MGWEIEIDTELSLHDNLELTHSILYQDKVVAFGREKLKMDENSHLINRQKLFVKAPLLWSPEEPNLYQLRTKLQIDDLVIESISQNLGFKNVVLDPKRGFILNGTKMKLNGVCEHHDLGALGAAFNKSALARRFKILKDMGVNAIRTAHNMPAKEFMDLADEMGMLVISEAFDMWELPKTKYDYARFFKEWAYRDVRSWVKRDRNHPSLIMWSIGNEIYDTHAGKRGQEITKMLRDYVLEHDPRGNGAVTIGSNYMPWEGAQKCADLVKVAGYNYSEKNYHEHHERYTDWIIYGSETGSVVQSRGVYHFPYEESLLSDEDEQCSALGNSSTSWGARSTEACIIADRDAPFSLGTFVWTGFDYLGEPTPYHTKNSYFGQIDTATFTKDSYYVYQGAWTDYKVKPMVHILPYWDFNEGQKIDVRVCSNAPMIELKLNDETIGTHQIDHRQGSQLVGWWKLPYKPGELKAIAYDETGRIIATHIRRSFGDAVRIRLKADKERLFANGTDLIFVEISMEDAEGNPVENASNRVRVNVSGAGRLIGLDNGDSTDFDQYKGLSKRLFSGKLMAIVGAKIEPGNIYIDVSSRGLESAHMLLKAESAHPIPGISALTENREMPCITGKLDEIPVRKIEIVSDDGLLFDEQKRKIKVRALLHPANTSYPHVEWAIVNERLTI